MKHLVLILALASFSTLAQAKVSEAIILEPEAANSFKNIEQAKDQFIDIGLYVAEESYNSCSKLESEKEKNDCVQYLLKSSKGDKETTAFLDFLFLNSRTKCQGLSEKLLTDCQRDVAKSYKLSSASSDEKVAETSQDMRVRLRNSMPNIDRYSNTAAPKRSIKPDTVKSSPKRATR